MFTSNSQVDPSYTIKFKAKTYGLKEIVAIPPFDSGSYTKNIQVTVDCPDSGADTSLIGSIPDPYSSFPSVLFN